MHYLKKKKLMELWWAVSNQSTGLVLMFKHGVHNAQV